MPKPKDTEKTTSPTDFPATTPPLTGADLSTWLLSAVTKNTEAMGRVEATAASLRTQMERMETKLDVIATEVKGHGNWIHTLKHALLVIGIIIGWAVVYAVGPWVKMKLFPGP